MNDDRAMPEVDWGALKLHLRSAMDEVNALTNPRRNKCDVEVFLPQVLWTSDVMFAGRISWGGPSGCRIETPAERSVVDVFESLADQMGWPYKRDGHRIEVSHEVPARQYPSA